MKQSMPNCGYVIFACHESTLAVHSEKPSIHGVQPYNMKFSTRVITCQITPPPKKNKNLNLTPFKFGL